MVFHRPRHGRLSPGAAARDRSLRDTYPAEFTPRSPPTRPHLPHEPGDKRRMRPRRNERCINRPKRGCSGLPGPGSRS